MGLATSLGSASVTLAGLESSVTKVSHAQDTPASGVEDRSSVHPAWLTEPAQPEATWVMPPGPLMR